MRQSVLCVDLLRLAMNSCSFASESVLSCTETATDQRFPNILYIVLTKLSTSSIMDLTPLPFTGHKIMYSIASGWYQHNKKLKVFKNAC